MREYHRRNPDKNREAVRRYRQSERGKFARRKTDAERRKRNQQRLDEIKVERGCKHCGYNANPAALQFHHRDPTTKTRGAFSGSWSRAEQEIEKCDVLCANCHSIHHYGE